MVVCSLCQNITIASLIQSWPSRNVKGAIEVGYEHYESFEQLEASAATCELCSLIVRAVNKPADFIFKPHKRHHIRLMGSGRNGVSSLTVVVAGSNLRAYFNVVADPGKCLAFCGIMIYTTPTELP
jgi:hypothetical protein